MKIIIAGAGNVGTHLAKLLSREKQDNNLARCVPTLPAHTSPNYYPARSRISY